MVSGSEIKSPLLPNCAKKDLFRWILLSWSCIEFYTQTGGCSWKQIHAKEKKNEKKCIFLLTRYPLCAEMES